MIRKKLFLAVLLLGSICHYSTVKAQFLFDPSIIQNVEIDFYDVNWEHKLDSLAALNAGTGSGTGRILADVTLNGTAFDSCGVRFKGNSSMDTTSNKNPFNIDLNYVIPGQKYQGKDKIKLANCFADPSMIREVLTYELANQYMDCPRANFAKLYINGGYRGIYSNTESVDNEFLDEFYGSSNNSFFKCDPNSFVLFGDNSNLAFHADTMAYDTLYDKKSTWGLEELQTLTNNLAFNIPNIEQFFDVDRALWFLALSSAFVHNDGYTAFGHNYYVYEQDNGRWSIVLWDVNMSFGGLLWNGENILPMNAAALETQDPFIHVGNAIRPLIAQLLAVPQYNRMYVAHFKTIMEENVNNGYYMQRAQFWHDLIDADVPAEPYPFYSYQDFVDNLTVNVGTWFDLRPGIQSLMVAREPYIYSLPQFQVTQPSISNVTAPTQPDPFTLVTITADANLADNVSLGYRYNQFDAFVKTPMFDDGAHNDGASGDGIYGVEVAIQGADMQYYIYAENGNAARFSPARAEYEFYTITPLKGLVINELSAENGSIATDLAGEYDDWIELYNNTANPIDLTGYHLSDESGNLLKWALPSFTLQPGEYFIVWADEDMLQSGVHASFQLSSLGESLFLSDDLGFLIDVVIFPPQFNDITWGRYPNGTGPFNFLWPTFGATNSPPVGTDEIEIPEIAVYPNPAMEYTTIQVEQPTDADLRVFDMSGKMVFSDKLNGTSYNLDVRSYQSGTYLIKLSTGQTSKLVIKP